MVPFLVHTELKVVRNGPLLPLHPELGGVSNGSLFLVQRVSSSPFLPPLGRSWGWKSVHLACEKKNPLPSEQLARPTHYILRQSLSCSAGFEFLLCSKVLLNLISSCLSFPNSWNHCVECVHTDRMQRKLELGLVVQAWSLHYFLLKSSMRAGMWWVYLCFMCLSEFVLDVCTCLYSCIHVFTLMYMHMYACDAHEGQKSLFSDSLNCFLPYFLA